MNDESEEHSEVVVNVGDLENLVSENEFLPSTFYAIFVKFSTELF